MQATVCILCTRYLIKTCCPVTLSPRINQLSYVKYFNLLLEFQIKLYSTAAKVLDFSFLPW